MFHIDKNETPSCQGIDIDIFYPEVKEYPHNNYMQLRKICNNCELLTKCREWSILHEKWGFWGGMSERERQMYRKKFNILVQEPNEIGA